MPKARRRRNEQRRIHPSLLLHSLVIAASYISHHAWQAQAFVPSSRRQVVANSPAVFISKRRHALHRDPKTTSLCASKQPKPNRGEGEAKDPAGTKKKEHKRLEDDIASRLSISKYRAISALSQPNNNTSSAKLGSSQSRKSHAKAKGSNNLISPHRTNPMKKKSQTKRTVKRKSVSSLRARSRRKNKKDSPQRKHKGASSKRKSQQREHRSSLLPPPLTDISSHDVGDEEEEDPLSSGLSSWEEFLGVEGGGWQPSSSSSPPNKTTGGRSATSPSTDGGSEPSLSGDDLAQRLPSIQDLFPPDISSATPAASQTSEKPLDGRPSTRKKAQVTLDGVLPVSDLFYRSTQSGEEEHDDEELPFSAEQSDAVSSENNKVRIRRNLANGDSSKKTNKRKTGKAKPRGRKMVRRGMEMLVGGIPINADPPQRSVELIYDSQINAQNLYSNNKDRWVHVISLNTRDFGPLWHTASIPKVSRQECGLFCEYWSRATLKWDICPPDLRQIVKLHTSQKQAQLRQQQQHARLLDHGSREQAEHDAVLDEGLHSAGSSAISSPSDLSDDKTFYETEGECSFELGLSRQELESAPSDVFESVFARGFAVVIKKEKVSPSTTTAAASNKNSPDGTGEIRIEIPKLTFTETDDGYTDIHVAFKVLAVSDTATSQLDMERRTKRMNDVLQQAMDDGNIALALAAAAQEEDRWPNELRDRIVEEWLFQDDVIDEPEELAAAMAAYSPKAISEELQKQTLDKSAPSKREEPAKATSLYTKEDLFLGGGQDGVFYNFSAANAHIAPYGGEIGLRLVSAVTERAKQRLPRVIAIGDVHGCIDELQDLLRECDYRPGDLVVFLGDLVCKGPDSISVVQMAREIGAIGVRGNHDFEVVRWHQAIKSGVDPPVVGSEHFHIASCLSKADMKWMYSLPWYISSKDLGSLFVHAGFVSGIRLPKQNPRLMMNMRSILPDGTVTSKFFNNWPWARLWDGPQTVFFGHGTYEAPLCS